MRARVCSTRRRFGAVHASSIRRRRTSSPLTPPPRLTCPRSPNSSRCKAMFGGAEPPEPAVPDFIPSTPIESDWRRFRARLVTRYQPVEDSAEEWAHLLPAPELGCVLVAHPLMFTQKQTYFNLAVIFIFVHDHTGSAGLILNKPTRYALGDLGATQNVAAGFEENPLYLGGDVGESAVNLLHSHGDLEAAVEVVKGVYLNGFEAAQRAVLKGAKSAADFKWYARYCGWNPGQLEEECRSGVWFPAACSAQLVVKECSAVDGAADLWHQVMQMMGGEYKALSDVIIGTAHKTEAARPPPEEF